MSITFRVLGSVHTDNALLVKVDSGQAVEYLMFDCGEGCFAELPFSERQDVDHLFFSHLHMDHVAGFDSFFRCNFNRNTKVNRIWGPPGTVRSFHHRFQSFLWNLHEKMAATWKVTDIHRQLLRTSRFELNEGFEINHDEGARLLSGPICDGEGFRVEALTLSHGTPSMGYIVREKLRRNVDLAKLEESGLKPGPWVKDLKDSDYRSETIEIAGVSYSTKDLRRDLIQESQGDSVAYLTDFLLGDAATLERVAEVLSGCEVLVCEAQYRKTDHELAQRNFHMTTALTAKLAQRAGVGELVLIHLSDRYQRAEWGEMLEEARAIFPATRFPESWTADPKPG